MSAPAMVNIALTLQRIGGEWREKGLSLFEQLLGLNINDARSAINELDKRLVAINRQPRRRRRSK